MRRAIIYGDKKGTLKAYLTSFVLYTERIEGSQLMIANPMLMNSSTTNFVEQQSIQLNTKALEHLYSVDRIQPFIQKLFYSVELSEMITIANTMVEMSRIIRGK
jgi:hypothetical protein